MLLSCTTDHDICFGHIGQVPEVQADLLSAQTVIHLRETCNPKSSNLKPFPKVTLRSLHKHYPRDPVRKPYHNQGYTDRAKLLVAERVEHRSTRCGSLGEHSAHVHMHAPVKHYDMNLCSIGTVDDNP